MSIFLAIILLGLIILFHEFGHFIVAKANGVCVVEFSIGFGPRLFSFRKGDTDYCLKMLPFGGSCRMLSSDEELYELDEEQKERKGHEFEKQSAKLISKYGKAAAFETKSLPARIAVIAAGPLYNFILAFFMSVLMLGFMGVDTPKVSSVETKSVVYESGLREGDIITDVAGTGIVFDRELTRELQKHTSAPFEIKYKRDGVTYTADVNPIEKRENLYKIGAALGDDATISGIEDDSPAQKAKLKVNDKIIMINGENVSSSKGVIEKIKSSEGKELTFKVERGGNISDISVTPGKTDTVSYDMGFSTSGERVKVSPWETILYGLREVWYWITTIVDLLGRMVTGRLSLSNLSGPVGTVSAISNVIDASSSDGAFFVLMNLIYIGIMLSANLGVMNLLPIPGLDGGRLILYAAEAVTGRPVPKEKEGIINFIGFIFLMLLTVIVLVKDIIRLF